MGIEEKPIDQPVGRTTTLQYAEDLGIDLDDLEMNPLPKDLAPYEEEQTEELEDVEGPMTPEARGGRETEEPKKGNEDEQIDVVIDFEGRTQAKSVDQREIKK